MKLELPFNENYCARVIKVTGLRKADNSDNLQVIPSLGMQAVVDISTKEGDLGVFFPAGVKLADAYLSYNNMFRHSEKNRNTESKGYIEDDRRVKAVTLRGNRSDALFMPLSSLAYLGIHDWSPFVVGAAFDRIDGEMVCEKYERPVRVPRGMNVGKSKVQSRVNERFFPQQAHVTNYFYVPTLPHDTRVILTQKLHGTNIRVGFVPVERNLTWRERLALRFGVRVERVEYRMVYGSHHVVKDANNPDQQHFYDHDLWTERGHDLDGYLPKGFVVYGELIGFTRGGKPIQSHYTYDCAPNTNKLYVYRVTQISVDGVSVDLSWEAVKEFCRALCLNHVPELYAGPLSGVDIDSYLDINFVDVVDPRMRPVPLSADSPCDEGVAIRIEGIHPQIYKAKSPLFVAHESRQLEAVDDSNLEDNNNNDEEPE